MSTNLRLANTGFSPILGQDSDGIMSPLTRNRKPLAWCAPCPRGGEDSSGSAQSRAPACGRARAGSASGRGRPRVARPAARCAARAAGVPPAGGFAPSRSPSGGRSRAKRSHFVRLPAKSPPEQNADGLCSVKFMRPFKHLLEGSHKQFLSAGYKANDTLARSLKRRQKESPTRVLRVEALDCPPGIKKISIDFGTMDLTLRNHKTYLNFLILVSSLQVKKGDRKPHRISLYRKKPIDIQTLGVQIPMVFLIKLKFSI